MVPLLDEVTEGSRAGAGADHDAGCAGDEAMEGSLWDSNEGNQSLELIAGHSTNTQPITTGIRELRAQSRTFYQSVSSQPTFLVLEVPLLDEATERSKAGAGANHDDGCAGLEGEAEL